VAIKLESSDGRDIAINDFGYDTSATSSAAGSTSITSADLSKDVAMSNAVTLDANTAASGSATDSAVATGQVTLTGSKGAITVSTMADFDTLTSTKSSLSALSISSASVAQTALQTVDAVLDQVTSARGDLGAYQNRFESVVANLQVTAENLSASRSRIVDADFAAETAALTKAQILQQSGIAMLAQANAIPQNVLALLQ
jgi:flagellin